MHRVKCSQIKSTGLLIWLRTIYTVPISLNPMDTYSPGAVSAVNVKLTSHGIHGTLAAV